MGAVKAFFVGVVMKKIRWVIKRVLNKRKLTVKIRYKKVTVLVCERHLFFYYFLFLKWI